MHGSAGFARLAEVIQSNGFSFDLCAPDLMLTREVAEQLSLPQEFIAYYESAGPATKTTVPWVVEELQLASFEELPSMQVGYRGGEIGAPQSSLWPAHLVVVGSIFDDPINVDLSSVSCAVSYARHGEGAWAQKQLASSLGTFLDALGDFEQVLLGDYGLDVWDDRGLRGDFIDDVSRSLVRTLTPGQVTNFVDLMT